MTLTTSPPPWDALAPLRFPPDLRLTPEQFALVCAETRDAVLELAADGRVISTTPTGSETGARNSRLKMRLLLWADRQGPEGVRQFQRFPVPRQLAAQSRLLLGASGSLAGPCT